MKGSEILKRFEKAKQVVQKRFGVLGEIGDFLRHNGYEVHLDGFSTCRFGEQDVKIRYGASESWKIWDIIHFNDHYDDKLPVGAINPDEDYNILPNPSRTELLEKGIIKPKSFRVFEVGGRYADRNKGEFDTFEKADQCARRLCQEEIERLRKDRDWRPHTPSSVRNNELRAKELWELRHYTDYCYQCHEYWFAVKDVRGD